MNLNRRQFVKLSLAGLASLMVPVNLLKANTIDGSKTIIPPKTIDIDALKKAAALLSENNVPPIVIDGKQYYVAYISGHEFRVPVSSMRI